MSVNVIAVIGTCAPERLRYAKTAVKKTGSPFIRASRLSLAPDPVDEAAALLPWFHDATDVIVEFPLEVDATHIIGAFTGDESGNRLTEIVCVVDAAHLLADLHHDDYVQRYVGPFDALRSEHTARALLTVTQLEFASTIILVNWNPLDTPTLSAVMALACHLAPHARLRLLQDRLEMVSDPATTAYSVSQDRPGWVGVLNNEFDPHMTDPQVSAYRYEHHRPLHPGRLLHLLDRRIGTGEFGTIIRSAGFCRFATRADVIAQWQHVGSMISFEPLVADGPLDHDEDLLAIGQHIAFIGLDLDHHALAAALDEAALSDAEFADGPAVWATLEGPLPCWEWAVHRPK